MRPIGYKIEVRRLIRYEYISVHIALSYGISELRNSS